MPEGEDDALREAAAHRGLKLVKSRKRKAGVGDYGRFGLTDASGKELFGFGPDGLTALPADIRDYLRKSEVSTWAQSAKVTPDRPKPARSAPEPIVAANDTEMLEEEAPSAAASDGEPRKKRAAAGRNSRPRKLPPPSKKKAASQPEQPRSEPEHEPEPEPEPEPQMDPEPALAVRNAAKADVDDIRTLTGAGVPAAEFASRFNELKRAGGGVIVADRGGVVGCVAWQVILGLHEAPIGRLTVLVVAEDARRQGVGRALVDAARSAMIDQGCATIEGMSDIEVRNVNGFYRAIGFAQKSYRFVSERETKS